MYDPLDSIDPHGNGSYRQRRKAANAGNWGTPILLGLGLIVILAIVIPACSSYYSTKHATVVVNSHERVCSGSSNGTTCQYLVFTDKGTYKITDSLIIGRFNSSDVYGAIKDGKTYNISYYGFRFGCTSSYPNIKTMDLVKT